MNSSKGKTQESGLSRGNKGKKEEQTLPRCTIATGVRDDKNSQEKEGYQGQLCPGAPSHTHCTDAINLRKKQMSREMSS